MQTILLLTISNIFMTFAWYAHLKSMNHKPWIIAALVSWGIALFEYLLQVPANRIGHTVLSVGQLKILQEVITLTVFVPFSIFYLKEDLKWDYLWAGLCILGAVFFVCGMASIAAVARVTCVTRAANAEFGIRLTVEAGQAGAVTEAASPQGTSITVR